MARPDENGMIVCTGCERELPGNVQHFHQHRDAFKPRCKECRGSSFGIHSPNKVFDTGRGEKICTNCNRVLPTDSEHFAKSNKTSDGFTPQCKECRSNTEFGVHRPNRIGETPSGESIPDGMWFCPGCEQVLQLSQQYFYRSGGGFEKFCKTCSTLRKNQTRRHNHPDLSPVEWRFIKANWLEEGVVRCAYCGCEAKKPERDHVQPISDNGETVPENIVPACESCNRSKGGSLVTEWYPDSGVFDPTRWEKIQSHLRGETPIPE